MRPFEIILYLSCYYNNQTAQQVCINQAIKGAIRNEVNTFEACVAKLDLSRVRRFISSLT